MVGRKSQVVGAEVVARRRAEQRRSLRVAALPGRGRGIPARAGARHPQEAVRAAVSQVNSMEGGLRGGTVTPHPRCCGHARGEGATRLALQIDAEAVGVLGMLEQEPGTGEGLLAGGAGITAGLIFI